MSATRHVELMDGKLVVYYKLAAPVQYTADESGVPVNRQTYRIRIRHVQGRNSRYQVLACDETGKLLSEVPIREGIEVENGENGILEKEFAESVTAHVNSYAAFKNLAIRAQAKE